MVIAIAIEGGDSPYNWFQRLRRSRKFWVTLSGIITLILSTYLKVDDNILNMVVLVIGVLTNAIAIDDVQTRKSIASSDDVKIK